MTDDPPFPLSAREMRAYRAILRRLHAKGWGAVSEFSFSYAYAALAMNAYQDALDRAKKAGRAANEPFVAECRVEVRRWMVELDLISPSRVHLSLLDDDGLDEELAELLDWPSGPSGDA